jgi:hypothetical protein
MLPGNTSGHAQTMITLPGKDVDECKSILFFFCEEISRSTAISFKRGNNILNYLSNKPLSQ